MNLFIVNEETDRKVWNYLRENPETSHDALAVKFDINQAVAKKFISKIGTPIPVLKAAVEKRMTRADILDTAKEYVTKDRAAAHGDAEDNFGRIAAYWSAHLDVQVSAHDVAVMMNLLKLARIKSVPGNPDNWIDAAGYAACGGEIAIKNFS